MTSKGSLDGANVLIVEDEPLISMFIEDCLSDIGCNIAGTATSLPEAMTKASELECDAVVLDVNLNGALTIALAESLFERSRPFIFSTGYGHAGIPSHLRHIPILQKPFHESDLREALTLVLTHE